MCACVYTRAHTRTHVGGEEFTFLEGSYAHLYTTHTGLDLVGACSLGQVPGSGLHISCEPSHSLLPPVLHCGAAEPLRKRRHMGICATFKLLGLVFEWRVVHYKAWAPSRS